MSAFRYDHQIPRTAICRPARRADAAYLASLVVSHQLSEEDAVRTARRIVSDIPRATFKL